jgi:hypothetical protein
MMTTMVFFVVGHGIRTAHTSVRNCRATDTKQSNDDARGEAIMLITACTCYYRAHVVQ